jgi:hypothetical protein
LLHVRLFLPPISRLQETTYLFATSDHGYHFGELRLGGGKWNVYDTDVRVPMRVVGPTIRPRSLLGLVGSHVDLAPTWLGLAGLATPVGMDGRSLAGALLAGGGVGAPDHSSRSGEAALAPDQANERQPLTPPQPQLPVGSAYIEYHGLGPTGATAGPWFRWQDALNNTYRALRVARNTFHPPFFTTGIAWQHHALLA